MGFTLTSIILAVLLGAISYFSWHRNRTASLISGFICVIVSAVAIIASFALTVSWIFKALPIVILILAVVLVYLILTRNKGKNAPKNSGVSNVG